MFLVVTFLLIVLLGYVLYKALKKLNDKAKAQLYRQIINTLFIILTILALIRGLAIIGALLILIWFLYMGYKRR